MVMIMALRRHPYQLQIRVPLWAAVIGIDTYRNALWISLAQDGHNRKAQQQGGDYEECHFHSVFLSNAGIDCTSTSRQSFTTLLLYLVSAVASIGRKSRAISPIRAMHGVVIPNTPPVPGIVCSVFTIQIFTNAFCMVLCCAACSESDQVVVQCRSLNVLEVSTLRDVLNLSNDDGRCAAC
jgi:hypothetical protein